MVGRSFKMEMQRSTLAFLAVLILTAVIICGCFQEKAPESGAQPTEEALEAGVQPSEEPLQTEAESSEEVPEFEAQPTEEAPEETTKESIQDILAKAETLGPMKYEVVANVSMTGLPPGFEMPPMPPVTMVAWQKRPYMRFDTISTNETTRMIIHPDAIYYYVESQDKYDRISVEELANMTMQKSLEEVSKEIREKMTLKVLGTVIIDGKLATVVEYSIPSGRTTVTQKLWIWNEKGIPLRSEVRLKGMSTTIEYKNFVLGDIPDEIFEVPEEKIIEYPA